MKSLQTVFFTIDTLTLADKDVRDFAHIVVPMSVRVSFFFKDVQDVLSNYYSPATYRVKYKPCRNIC